MGTYSSSNMRRRWTASMPASGASAMVEALKDRDSLAGREAKEVGLAMREVGENRREGEFEKRRG